MSAARPQAHSADVLHAVEQLALALEALDRNDLSALAKMHAHCETIVAAAAGEGDAAGEVRKLAAGGLRDLEALILGEARDVDATLRNLTQCIDQLTQQTPAWAGAAAERAEPASGGQAMTEAPAESAEASDARSATDAGGGNLEEEADLSAADEQPGDASASARETPVVEAYRSQPLRIDRGELDFVKGFVDEASEHIAAIEAAVLGVENDPQNAARIDDLFRPFHTIKGMAGFLNLRDVNCVTHEVETLLDQGRKGKRNITTETIDLIFEVVDVLKAQVSQIGAYVAEPRDGDVPQPPVEALIARLRAVVASPAGVPASSNAQPPTVIEPQAERAPPPAAVAAKAPAAARAATAEAGEAGRPVVATLSESSVRIDTAKLDSLVDMVGELVIAQTLVSGSAATTGERRISRDVAQVTKIIRDIQEVAMSMRMVPIGPTFQKMARLVRDVSRKAGKQVDLKIAGEDTELDKNVIEQIGDPLVHMVRNAVDHGVEPSAQRLAAGKSEAGQVSLGAHHQGGNIVITIADDGRGLDPKKLIAKGIERGLVQPGQELTDQQAFALIFAPGFSTAEVVTDISGRGVGMDVVRRNLEKLRGSVEISSEVGAGSTFSIRLPLTLAIIDGMIVRVGQERFIIPTIAIEQSRRPTKEQLTRVQGRAEILNVRGKLIPLIQLGELFAITGRVDPCEAMVVTAECDGQPVGLVVEELIGQQQVVIKSLGPRFERLRGISGAAILGDGRVGLILEVSGLVAAHSHIDRRNRSAQRAEAGSEDTEQSRRTLAPAGAG